MEQSGIFKHGRRDIVPFYFIDGRVLSVIYDPRLARIGTVFVIVESETAVRRSVFHQIFLADFCLTQNIPHIRSQKVVRNLGDNGAV